MIDIVDVTKTYKNKKGIFDINLHVHAGEFCALIGVNGAGKTTLVKAIIGALFLDSGTIRIGGYPSFSLQAKKNIAFLPEVVEPLAYLRGQEYIALMARLSDKELDKEYLYRLCEDIAFEKKALQQRIATYSKGMKQKISLLATFLADTPIVILDEPMSGLDPLVRAKLKHFLLAQKGKKTIFFASHILADVEELADSIAVMHEGKLIYRGTPGEFIKQHKSQDLESAFLDTIGVVQ